MIHSLAPDEIASVVTYLDLAPIPAPDHQVLARADVHLQRQTDMTCAAYRAMFKDVGQHWLWFSRLRMTDEDLRAIIHSSETELYTLHDSADDVIGFLELDCADLPRMSISFLGVVPGSIARGLGSYLMAQTFQRAKAMEADVLCVHTCTFDHPRALAFYQKAGFRVSARGIEIAHDPRLDGTLPITAAPHVPCLKR